MLLKTPKSPQPDPETLALQALAFLAAEDDRLHRFLALTGIESGQLKEIAVASHGLGAVLDYLLGFEPLLLEFAAAIDIDPAVIVQQRRQLPS